MSKSCTKKSVRVPYNKLADDEKVCKNWNKALKLYERGEWSVAIIRCGTCLELAINYAIRDELVLCRNLPLPFVDRLLKNSNGIHNKFHNICIPIMEEYEEIDEINQLWREMISTVNTERNAVAHRGEFRSKMKAKKAMSCTYKALIEIFVLHSSKSKLKPFEI